MRTTLTIDADVATRLQRLGVKQRGQKQLINHLLRLGLDQLERHPQVDHPPFRTESYRLSAKVPNLDDIAEVLATSETEDWR